MKKILFKVSFIFLLLFCYININIATGDSSFCPNCKNNISKSFIEYSLDYLAKIKEITKKNFFHTNLALQDKAKQKFAQAIVIVFDYVDSLKAKLHLGMNTVKDNIDKIHEWAEIHNIENEKK